jgi:hypothetical protein
MLEKDEKYIQNYEQKARRNEAGILPPKTEDQISQNYNFVSFLVWVSSMVSYFGNQLNNLRSTVLSTWSKSRHKQYAQNSDVETS